MGRHAWATSLTRSKRASASGTAASVPLTDEDEDPAEDASSRMEKGLLGGRARQAKAGPQQQRANGCARAARAARTSVENCFDAAAWRSVDRLVFAFRSTQYQDIIVTLASLVVTWTLGNQYDRKSVQVPVVSLMISLLSVPVPFAGISASFGLRQTTIQGVVIYAILAKLVYSSLLLWYLYQGVGADPEVVLPETVLAAIRIALGLLIIVFGSLASMKIARMKRQRKTVLVIGLDGHGKSLLVDTALPAKAARADRKGAVARSEWEVNPTAGLRMHELLKFDSFWRIWDMAGNGRGRALWPFYYGSVDAIFFVVDASDLKRLAVVKQEFFRMAEHPEVRRKAPALVVILNKIDAPETSGSRGTPSRLSATQVRQLLRFDTLSQHYKLHVQTASAIQGFGMDDSLQWVANNLVTLPGA